MTKEKEKEKSWIQCVANQLNIKSNNNNNKNKGRNDIFKKCKKDKKGTVATRSTRTGTQMDGPKIGTRRKTTTGTTIGTEATINQR